MMIYRVVFERDGATKRGDGTGITSTDLIRTDHRYAANEIQLAWAHALDYLASDPEQRLIAIVEEHPLLAVIPDSAVVAAGGGEL